MTTDQVQTTLGQPDDAVSHHGSLHSSVAMLYRRLRTIVITTAGPFGRPDPTADVRRFEREDELEGEWSYVRAYGHFEPTEQQKRNATVSKNS